MSSTSTEPADAPGNEVAQMPAGQWLGEALQIDSINAQRLALIKNTVAKDASVAEVGMFLELAAKYDLDPFAKEVWCVKGKNEDGGTGRLLIMVGRDGLRKIAKRAGIHIDGDVVHAKDGFEIVRSPNGNRTVTHTWGNPAARGDIIGAWAECRAGGPEGQPLGFFYAELDEYMPTNARKLQYSPWGSQKSVMILAAAERQALRQATPLSGLLVEGEADRNLELEAGGTGTAPADLQATVAEHIHAELQDRAMEVLTTINELAPNSWGPGKIEMVFKDKTTYAQSAELGGLEQQVEELRAGAAAAEPAPAREGAREAEIAEAEIVEPEHASGMPAASELREPTADEQEKMTRLSILQEQLDEIPDLTEQQTSDIEAEMDALRGELPPDIGPGQETLPL